MATTGVGYYIHYRTSNYFKYGTAHIGGASQPSLTTAFFAQKQKNKERIQNLPEIDSSVINNLKTRVKQHWPEGKDEATAKRAAALQEKKYAEVFKEKLLSPKTIKKITYAGFDVAAIQNMTFDNTKVADIDAILRKKDAIRKNIEYIDKHFNEGNFADARTLTTLINNINEYFRMLGAIMPEGSSVISKKDIVKMDMVSAMKAATKAAAFDEAEAAINGALGEATVAMCGDVAVAKGLEAINGVIVGTDTSSFKLDSSLVPKFIEKKFKQDTGRNLYQAYSTQDKVDVLVVVDKQPLNVSVKTYKASSSGLIKAHLQDVSLLTSLATTTENFANHWLNLHCAAIKFPGVNAIDKALEEHIRYEALVSGNLLKQGVKLTNTFVAIDSLRGKVYAESAKNLLSKNTNNFYLDPSVGSLSFDNRWSDRWWGDRIYNIIKQVHATKIAVTLKVKTI